MTSTISFDRVTKRYRPGGPGVFDLSFEVRPGEVFGFLGSNGAGKTTTIRLLLDLIRPQEGRITVGGLDARRDSVALHRRIGYLPGELALYEKLTGREVLTHFAHLRGGIPWASIQLLVDLFDLDIDEPIRSLSKGNKQKVGLVQAFMGSPELLVLDEPTSGLDPIVQQQVHAHLRMRADEGATIFLSSHVLGEVAAVADRVGIIRAGRLVAIEDVAELASRAVHRVDARFAAAPTPEELSVLASVAGVRGVRCDGTTLHLEHLGPIDALVKALARHDVAELLVREPSLEEVFLSFYEGGAS